MGEGKEPTERRRRNAGRIDRTSRRCGSDAALKVTGEYRPDSSPDYYYVNTGTGEEGSALGGPLAPSRGPRKIDGADEKRSPTSPRRGRRPVGRTSVSPLRSGPLRRAESPTAIRKKETGGRSEKKDRTTSETKRDVKTVGS